MCISWNIKCWILLTHGVTMKFIEAILEVGVWCVHVVMFWYLKNLCRKLYISLKEPYEDTVLRNTNMATPRTVETNCHQDTEPNVIQKYYKYLTFVLFSAQEEIKSRLKLGNACYYSVQNLLSSSLLSKKDQDI